MGAEARVLIGRCLSYGEGITYWPLVEMVGQATGTDPRSGLEELLATEEEGSLAVERLAAALGLADTPAPSEEIFWAVRKLFEALARELKKACGTGGHAVPGALELQGDQRERLRELLARRGWAVRG